MTSVKTWKATFSQPWQEYELLQLPLLFHSLDETSLQLPGGAYTTFRTYGGDRALLLGDHLRRLQATAEMAGVSLHSDPSAWRMAVRDALNAAVGQSSDVAEWRLRLTLDLEIKPGVLYISIQPLQTLPEEAYARGVWVVTCSLQRQLPQAKLTGFIARAGALRRNLPQGVNEAIMYDTQGCLLEGLSSNFFAVRDGELHTAGTQVLAGVTRCLALQAAERLQLPVHFTPLSLADLPTLDEAFITSASRGVLPVCKIDQLDIGAQCPGPLTQKLTAAFQALVDEQLETI